MARALALAALLISISFAGCLTDTEQAGAAAKAIRQPKRWAENLVGDIVAGAPLWNDPQNYPHPAFGWPTLSSPPGVADAPEWWQPIEAQALPATIRGIDLLAQSPTGVTKGAGIALFGRLAIIPGYGNPSAIVDITDPSKPVKLSEFRPQEGMANHRGATTIAYPDGRLITVISTGAGLDVWDITDPTRPEPLPPIKVQSHKVGVIPGTPIVVNAASRGGGQGVGVTPGTATGITEMFDLTDPKNPVRLPDFKNGYSCHHVYFWNTADKQRGICAGSQHAQLWDTKDPRNPTVIVSVPIPHGRAGVPSGMSPGPWAHYAGLSIDGKVLLVGDESGGGSTPPGCVAGQTTPAGSVGTPIGALWFYDVSNEKDPKLAGYYSPQNDPRVKATPTTSCTAHHGRLVPAPNRQMVAMSFYGAGVVLIDFTGIGVGKLPVAVDQWARGSDTWETWYYNGYLFTGDLARGMDTLKFE